MKPGMPWSVKGIDQEPREAAKDAARRSGMTLGEWLNSMILEQGEEGSSANSEQRNRPLSPAPQVHPMQRSETSIRLEDIAQQLAQLARKEQGAASQAMAFGDSQMGSNGASRESGAAVSRILDRIENNERQTVEAFNAVNERLTSFGRQFAAQAGERPAAEQGALRSLEKAVRSIVDHIEISDKNVQDNFQTLRQRLDELAGSSQDPHAAHLRDQAITALDRRLSDLAGRIETHRPDTAGLDTLRTEIGLLAERIDTVRNTAEQLANRAQTQAVQASQRELHEIENRILGVLKEAQTAFAAQGTSAVEVKKLRAEIGAINQRIEQLKNGSGVEHDVAGLRNTVEQLQNRVAQGQDMRPYMDLDRRLSELTHRVEQQAVKPHVAAEIDNRLAEMDGRMRDLVRIQPDPRQHAATERLLNELVERMARAEGQVSHIETIERAVNQLFESVDHNRNWAREAAEDAANRMAQRVLAELPHHAGQAPNHSNELRVLEEGLRNARETAVHADQRNQETLAAVHETLEHIISKLADLETAAIGQQLAQATSAATSAVSSDSQGQAWTPPYAEEQAPVAPGSHHHAGDAGTYPITGEELRAAIAEPEPTTSWQAPEPPPPQQSVPNSAGGDDYIAAARRAALAAAQGGTLGSIHPAAIAADKPKSLLKSLTAFRRNKDTASAAASHATPASAASLQAGPRKTLLLAGLLLLAAVGAFYVTSRPMDKPATAPVASQSQPVVPSTSSKTMAAPNQIVPAPPVQVQPEMSGQGQLPPPPAVSGEKAPGNGAAAEKPEAQYQTSVDPSDQIMTGSLPSGTAAVDMPPLQTGNQALRLAARNGDAAAQFIVATNLYDAANGQGDMSQAAYWYRKSADTGFALAQYRLATMYERGRGVPKDMATAMELYRRAAEQGNVRSMHNVAVLAAGNEIGSPDYQFAYRWFLAASQHGLRDSQFNLALFYERGLGVQKSPSDALFWYMVGAANKDAEAAKRVAVLQPTLPPEAVKAVIAKVKTWRPEPEVEAANSLASANPAWIDKRAGLQRIPSPQAKPLNGMVINKQAASGNGAQPLGLDPVLSQSFSPADISPMPDTQG